MTTFIFETPRVIKQSLWKIICIENEKDMLANGSAVVAIT